MPLCSRSSAIFGVIPKPEAEFSPLAITRSILPLRHDVRQSVANNLAPRRTHNVSNKKYAHN